MPESKRVIHTDLAKLDAHEVQPEEYEDIPELTDEFFDNAEIRLGEKLIRPARRPGRPPIRKHEEARFAPARPGYHRAVPRHWARLAIADQRRIARIPRQTMIRLREAKTLVERVA